jgi:hypothetical protein
LPLPQVLHQRILPSRLQQCASMRPAPHSWVRKNNGASWWEDRLMTLWSVCCWQ